MITGGDNAGFSGGPMDRTPKPTDRAQEQNLANRVDMTQFTEALGKALGQAATHVPEVVLGSTAAQAGKLAINSLVDMYKNAKTMNELATKAFQPGSSKETKLAAVDHSNKSTEAVKTYVAGLEEQIKIKESLV
jgi:hypothetical protein